MARKDDERTIEASRGAVSDETEGTDPIGNAMDLAMNSSPAFTSEDKRKVIKRNLYPMFTELLELHGSSLKGVRPEEAIYELQASRGLNPTQAQIDSDSLPERDLFSATRGELTSLKLDARKVRDVFVGTMTIIQTGKTTKELKMESRGPRQTPIYLTAQEEVRLSRAAPVPKKFELPGSRPKQA